MIEIHAHVKCSMELTHTCSTIKSLQSKQINLNRCKSVSSHFFCTLTVSNVQLPWTKYYKNNDFHKISMTILIATQLSLDYLN